ncbi:addiction module toxin, RelE/StbE family [Bosea sp. OK403]|uniref:type II toxin-antitoxin system RelE/ParE family toxin n=1 Tax=Bosea sp. OK403 TaxID=1855286 RepID=UPI0008E25962|nr:type II toxin-antitoxin system RelE/ParE family toxin [Bosea sp. OK403]SFJ90833.1 addiction module toxin, RelE/StbE family [Bosea sp. OK403]
MKLIWTPRAKDDLREVGHYIADFNPTAALTLVRRLRLAAKTLADSPAIGRPGRVEETRELGVSGTSYILPYRVREGRVEILAALHAARDWPDQF